jgi:porin
MAVLVLVWSPRSSAQTTGLPAAAAVSLPDSAPGERAYAATMFAPARANLLGNLWGLRPDLDTLGLIIGAVDTSEILGNATGGLHRGAAYDDAIQLNAVLDLGKAFGWEGGSFNVSAYLLNGRNLSADNLDTLQTASGIEAQRAARLWELWLQQTLLGGKLSIRIGQQSLDQEFIVSAGSAVFINTAMGWPLVPSADLYAGGPAYPLSSLGVRIQVQATSGLSILAGLFDDNPAGGKNFADDLQVRGAAQSGTSFSFNTGVLGIAEVQYSATPFNAAPANAVPSTGSSLRGVYKIGGWLDTGDFRDQRYDTPGLPLADPANPQTPRRHATNWSLYVVADQAVWQPDPAGARAVGLFVRVMAAPADRNLASFSINGGATLKQPLPGRDNDVLGVGFGIATISNRAAGFAADAASFEHTIAPQRSSESFIEITYQVQFAAWLTLQPDIQYVIRPAGGIINPQAPDKRIADEAVFGVRSTIVF